MSALPVCEVQLWGKRVGALADTPSGVVTFEFAPEFVASGLNISPLRLPLVRGRVFANTEDPRAFDGLPGVFADSLPDLYGKRVIERYFAQRDPGRTRFPSAVEHLLYIGSRGLGALTYAPAERVGPLAAGPLKVSYLVEQARKVMTGDLSIDIAGIMHSHATAGGQRPKAVICWDQRSNTIVQGLPPFRAGFEPWIIKFDGADGVPREFGRIERAYALMGEAAGLEVPTTAMIEEGGRAHFLSKRFDVLPDGERLHMHSLGGLLHVDYNKPRLVDYIDVLSAVQAVTGSQAEVIRMYRQMVFNVIARNQDDHVKNFAFLMDPQGRWRLSPAYDLTYANGAQWTSQHQITVAGVAVDPSEADMLKVAHDHAIPNAGSIIEEVSDAVARWPEFACAVGLSQRWTDDIQAAHRLGGRPVGYAVPR